MEIQRRASVSDQLLNFILERIKSGVYRSGERFPSESELCSEFGVSRATVRTALSALAARGMLVRKPGIGSFLNDKRRLETGLEQLESVVSMARRQELDTQTINLSIKSVQADSRLAEYLEIPMGAAVTIVRRTLVIQDQPVSYHEDYIGGKELAPTQVDRQFKGSVLDLLNQKHLPPIRDAVTEITAVIADNVFSTRLGISPSAPLILLKEKTFDEAGKVVSYSENYYVPDRFCLRVIRNKIPDSSIGEMKHAK